MAAVLQLWGAQTRVKKMREEARRRQAEEEAALKKAKEDAKAEAERNRLLPWLPATKSNAVDVWPGAGAGAGAGSADGPESAGRDTRGRKGRSRGAHTAPTRASRNAAARDAHRKAGDDIFFDSRRRRRMLEIINLEDGFPEPTEVPPVPEWAARRRKEVRDAAQQKKEATLTLVDYSGQRRQVPINNKAKDPFYIRIKHREKKSVHALADNEVLVPKRHFRERQVVEDRDKWTTLFALHHYLSHLDDIKARRAARGGIAHLRKHHRHQHHHHHHHAAAHGDGDDSSSGSSDDEDGDDEAYSKLAILTANSHYLPRLYECLYRACPVFIIRKNRFVAALRSFAMANRQETETDVVTRDAEYATVVELAERVAAAFGVGVDEEMDWRAVLCSLRMVSHPSQSALQHLRWFFIVFASGGVLALPASMPRMPQEDIMREYEARVARAKHDALVEEVERQKLYLEQVRVAPKRVPFPRMTLTQRLPKKSTKYPNVAVETQHVPTIVGLLCGTQVERWAAEEMAAEMMAHPYFSNPEQEARDRLLPYKERLRKFEEDLMHDSSLSGVSLLQRLKDKPGGLFYRKRVHLRAFDDMLMRDPIGKMLEPWEREADEDAACAFETLYHPRLREYMAEMRKVQRVSELVKRAANRWRKIKKVMVMDKWKFNTKARRLCRIRLNRVDYLSRKSLLGKYMQTWRRWLIADSAAIICQSAYRMHQGYCRVATFRAQWRASVRLNAWLKMKRGVMWYARETERRRVAAIDIQRSWRGRIGRKEARRALAFFYRKERGRLRREQRRWERHVRNMAAVCVQRLGRGYLGRRAAQDRRDELEAARQMEEQLEKWNREEDRKERLAETKARLDAEAEQKAKQRAAADKRQAQRVNALAIRRRMQVARKEIDDAVAVSSEKIKQRHKEIKHKYKQEGLGLRQRVMDRMHFLIQMTFNTDMTAVWKAYSSGKGYKEVQIVDPDKLTPDEKKQQSVLFTYITKNAKRLKDEVKQNTGITMPIGDARVDTFRSYILREVNAGMAEIKQRQDAEMELFNEWHRKLRAADARMADNVMGNFRRKAAVMMQRAWRHYHGWKSLLKLIRESYVRHFDEATGTYYYENLKTGVSQWEKPKILKNKEVEVYVKPPTPPPAAPSVQFSESTEEPQQLTYAQFWAQQAGVTAAGAGGGAGAGSGGDAAAAHDQGDGFYDEQGQWHDYSELGAYHDHAGYNHSEYDGYSAYS